MAGTSAQPPLRYDDVKQHASATDLWVIIKGKAYDLTTYQHEHPGGAAVIAKYAGRDCTEEFEDAHPVDIIKRTLPGGGDAAFRGDVDMSSVPAEARARVASEGTPAAGAGDAADKPAKPALGELINVFDFEAAAQREMLGAGRKKGWDYYASGADDEMTLRENHSAFQRVWLRPRVMVDVRDIDTSCTILGEPSASPVFLAAVALQKLGNPKEGELGWVRGAARSGTIFMVPTLSSCAFDDIIGARIEGQALFFQLYVNPDRRLCEELVRTATSKGCTALFITVDAPQLGRRERDMRNKAGQAANVQQKSTAEMGKRKEDKGTSAALTSFIDPSLNWADIAWFRSITTMKIVLKGIQTAADAVKAARHGCDGIVVSNHGGRQLDFARSGFEVLPEVMAALAREEGGRKMEVFVDGGIRRGTDIFKALALGAKAVGVGKPVTYANAGYGADGVERCMNMLQEELRNAMRLCGCRSIAEITPEHVDARFLDNHAVLAPADALSDDTYVRLATAQRLREASAAPAAAPAAAAAPPPDAPAAAPGAGGGGYLAAYLTRGTLRGVLASSSPARLHRSAVLLTVYTLLHALRNLLVLVGRDAFNRYCHALHCPLKRLVECYLLVGAGVHAVAAGAATWNKRRMIRKKPVADGQLLWTGIGLTAFLVAHLKSLRFGPAPTVTLADGTLMRDVYALQLRVFNDPGTVAWHLAAVWALWRHFDIGWPKTVNKIPGDDPAAQQKAPLAGAGRALAGPLAASFAVAPVYLFASQRPTLAKYLSW